MRRLNKDLRDDFWPDPFGLRDFLSNPNQTLTRIRPLLENYRPARGRSHAIPKANFTIRDSIQITGVDRLVYQALIDRLIPHVDHLLMPNVFSHRLNKEKPSGKWIFQNAVKQWSLFRDGVRQAVGVAPNSCIVVTDVSHYFESIRFPLLRRQIQKILGSDAKRDLDPCIGALFECLDGWSPHDRCGLPQNIDASSFLGNVFLDYVDKIMAREGYQIFRYMDDIRLVVRSEADARRAMMRIIQTLRELNLGVNSAKTNIIRPGSEKMQEHCGPDDPDFTRIEAAIGSESIREIQSIVPMLLQKTSQLINDQKTGDAIFRFCVNRITNLRSNPELRVADLPEITDAIIRLLVVRPAETDIFYRYLAVAPLSQSQLTSIEYLLTRETLTVYGWQNFHLWRLISHRRVRSDDLTARAHRLLNEEPLSPETAGAALYLGRHGDYADRRAIAKLLPNAPRGFFTRHYQIAIQELDPAERSKAYQDVAQRDDDAGALSNHLSSLHEPLYVHDEPEIPVDDLADSIPSIYP